MQYAQIKTPLNVNVSILHAGVGWRFLGFMLDAFFIFFYIWLTTYTFSSLFGLSNDLWMDNEDLYYDMSTFVGIIYTILLFPAIFYSLWTEFFFNGQSFGKMICGTRVVKINGYHAGFPEYFTRWAFRLVDFWTGFFMILFLIPIFGEETGLIISACMMMLSGFVAFFLIIRTKNSQRLGDIVAGTTVLKIREKHSIDITILEEITETYVPRYQQVLRLSDNDARIIKDTFKTARKNRDTATMSRLRMKLESVMEIKTEQTDEAFIDTVMKDFNFYTQKL